MLEIVSGDIIELTKQYSVEAIVNPNNKYMDYRLWSMWSNL